MTVDRRQLLGAGLGAGAGIAAMAGTTAGRDKNRQQVDLAASTGIRASEVQVHANSGQDVSHALQRAIDKAADARQPLLLSPGIYDVAEIKLRANTHLIGIAGSSILKFAGGSTFLNAAQSNNIRLQGLVLDGAKEPLDPARSDGLLMVYACTSLNICDIEVRNGLLNGISLRRASGRVADCTIDHAGQAGLRCVDAAAAGMEISHNVISHCDNNGIQVWRSDVGEDGSILTANRISHIKARAGGTGQNGNAINIFRANSVQVMNNHITDCAYSAIRGNASSNIQMIANNVQRLGEVALYAEFGFQGALIANNLIDHAATGIAVTNFSSGGRLAIIQGNMIRNLNRREFEPHDKRGNGIGVEADAVVSGNVIETAATSGIMVGWGKFMRDVSITSNLIRGAKLGIGISMSQGAGTALVAHNMISGSQSGAIRAMDHGRLVGGELVQQNGPAAVARNIHLMGNIAS